MIETAVIDIMMTPAYDITDETETTDWPAISRSIGPKSSASSAHSMIRTHTGRVTRNDWFEPTTTYE